MSTVFFAGTILSVSLDAISDHSALNAAHTAKQSSSGRICGTYARISIHSTTNMKNPVIDSEITWE